VPVALLVVAAIAGTVSQIGLLLATEKLHPSIENLSPAKGFSRMFSARGLVEFHAEHFQKALELFDETLRIVAQKDPGARPPPYLPERRLKIM